MKYFRTMVMILLTLLVVAGKPDKPPKPDDGNGDVMTIPHGSAIVDGDLSEWVGKEAACFPLYWAGQKNKPVLSEVCAVYDGSTMYVAGWPTDDNVINDKPDSMHAKINQVKLWEDTDYPPDGTLPEFDKFATAFNDGGFPTVMGFEAAATVAPGDYPFIAHISIFPHGEYDALGSGQSSRTLRDVVIGVN